MIALKLVTWLELSAAVHRAGHFERMQTSEKIRTNLAVQNIGIKATLTAAPFEVHRPARPRMRVLAMTRIGTAQCARAEFLDSSVDLRGGALLLGHPLRDRLFED